MATNGYTYKNVGKAAKTYYDITVQPGAEESGFPGYVNDPEMIRVFDAETEEARKVEFVEAFRITFLNWDESLISSAIYAKGTTLTPEDPTRPEDELYTYTFKGWDPELEEVTEDTTYTATYTAVAKE